MKAPVAALFVVLIGAVVALQALHERGGGPPAAATAGMLYVRSPEAMTRLALSYDSLLADVLLDSGRAALRRDEAVV